MHISLVTIFPKLFESFLTTSLIGKAVQKRLVTFECIDLRSFAAPPHLSVDDVPYGGGAGMVLKPEPLAKAIEHAKESRPDARVILMSASGETFTQPKAQELAHRSDLIFICGRYEGVDQRIIDLFVDEEISVGDYVVMGGEIPAMIVIEATTRLLQGVLGNEESLIEESHGKEDFLEAPHYTRPPLFRELSVPEILLSGNHQKISEWRRKESELRAKKRSR